ncbi:MAG: peptide chain release factor N(5)-glutamine methyltransferase [Legionella longbeachae]|nr:peptide chain release factor N(5)-glutamine methyltransferase [Legionella longbeachae]
MINIRTALGKNPAFETEILLCHALNKNRAYLFAHPEELLTQTQLEVYQKLMAKRAQGIPIAYLTGEREFWSLNLKVNQHTLIPRHETERLVELALEHIPNQANTYILELGTGSGAIALALAKERPHWQIIACDISEEALNIAKENAQILKINNVSFYQSNWFNKIPQRLYHAIVSNPPYIAEQDPHLQEGDLCFEPRNALVSSQEGLADLQYIINQGHKYLLPNGLILLEHGFDQKFKVRTILNELRYKNVQCWQDLQGQDRVSGGWR